jgi:hypothetical protein
MSSQTVKSQASYEIPKTQKAIVFEEQNGPLMFKTDWPVTQPEDLQPGEVLFGPCSLSTGPDDFRLAR